LVIFCVALVAAMRTRMSFRLAMGDQSSASAARNVTQTISHIRRPPP
jgi:hypothetical protein